jgi:hypothetical protein
VPVPTFEQSSSLHAIYVYLSALHYENYFLHHCDIRQRIAVDGDYVGELARFDCAYVIGSTTSGSSSTP